MSERNLQGILDRVRARYPEAALVVAGVRLPPNLGAPYVEAFQSMFPRLAKANDAVLIPRLLEGVAGDREFMLPDGIHPNASGHRRVADTVWEALAPLLGLADASAGAAQDLEGRDGANAAAAGDAEGDGQ
jgi:acyl-CoA thioesterase-1